MRPCPHAAHTARAPLPLSRASGDVLIAGLTPILPFWAHFCCQAGAEELIVRMFSDCGEATVLSKEMKGEYVALHDALVCVSVCGGEGGVKERGDREPGR